MNDYSLELDKHAKPLKAPHTAVAKFCSARTVGAKCGKTLIEREARLSLIEINQTDNAVISFYLFHFFFFFFFFQIM